MSLEPLRVVSIVEGTWVTGPIKPLFMVAEMGRAGASAERPVCLSLITTARLERGQTHRGNALISAAQVAGIDIDVVRERHAWDLSVVRQIARAVAARRPHIVETHQVKSHFLLAQAMLWGGLRREFAWIAYHHGYTKATIKLTLYEELDRWTLRRADHVVTVCRPFAMQLRKRGVKVERLSVISNAIQPRETPQASELQALRRRLGLNPTDRLLLSVGRLSAEKGHRYLIEAFAGLQTADNPSIHLVLVGDGPERAKLEQRARQICERIHFVGHQDDVWPYYFIADVFVLPSLVEGSPLVLFEAMAANSAIVATSVGGVPDTIDDQQSGLLVGAGNSAELSRAIEKILGDPRLRQRLHAGAAVASRKYTPREYQSHLMAIYENTMTRRALPEHA